MVEKITTRYTRVSLDKRLKAGGLSIKKWSEESRNIAAKYIYSEVKMGQKFTEQELESKRPLIDAQLAIAGYRLADTIIDILGDDKINRLDSHQNKEADEKKVDWRYAGNDDDITTTDDSDYLTATNNGRKQKVQAIKTEVLGKLVAGSTTPKKDKISLDSKVAVDKSTDLSTTDKEEIVDKKQHQVPSRQLK